jgi:hypothetical protein
VLNALRVRREGKQSVNVIGHEEPKMDEPLLRFVAVGGALEQRVCGGGGAKLIRAARQAVHGDEVGLGGWVDPNWDLVRKLFAGSEGMGLLLHHGALSLGIYGWSGKVGASGSLARLVSGGRAGRTSLPRN